MDSRILLGEWKEIREGISKKNSKIQYIYIYTLNYIFFLVYLIRYISTVFWWLRKITEIKVYNIELYCFDGVVIAAQCTATFLRSIVLSEFSY